MSRGTFKDHLFNVFPHVRASLARAPYGESFSRVFDKTYSYGIPPNHTAYPEDTV